MGKKLPSQQGSSSLSIIWRGGAGCCFGFCLRKIFPDLMNELHSSAAVLDSVLSDCLLLNQCGERREKLSRK